MIVDMHCHNFFGNMLENELIGDFLTNLIMNYTKKMGQKLDAETIKKRAAAIRYDRTGESMIESMDEAGIDVAVLLVGTGPTPDDENNRTAGEIAQKYPDRVIFLAGINPMHPGGPDRVKKCFEEYGCRGLKYHADFGYDPISPESYELLKVVNEHKGILLTHTGPLGGFARSSMTDVSRLADLLNDFPELPVVASHMGLYNWRPFASLAAFHDNLYGDLSMWEIIAFGNYPFFRRELRDLIDCAGLDKIAFGSDDPTHKIVRKTKDWVELIKNLPKDAPEGVAFTDEEVAAILGGNAVRILGLEE